MDARTALPDELTVGSTFARHRIEGVAGRGGMGVVFRATDLALDRPVALKLIAPGVALDPVFRARFEHECRAAASIDHPHAVEVFHAGEEDGLLYVTMRYVEGEDLGALTARDAPVDAVRAVRIIAQVAAALDAAHARGLVHRDVKPTNVLVAERDGVEHAFLTDFGLTKRNEGEAGLTKPGFAMGTADYMAPEQARGAPGRRAGRRLRARVRPLQDAHGHRAVRPRQRPGEDARASQGPAALAQAGASGRPARARRRGPPGDVEGARRPPAVGGRVRARGAGRGRGLRRTGRLRARTRTR